jgi:hypothetical protein
LGSENNPGLDLLLIFISFISILARLLENALLRWLVSKIGLFYDTFLNTVGLKMQNDYFSFE